MVGTRTSTKTEAAGAASGGATSGATAKKAKKPKKTVVSKAAKPPVQRKKKLETSSKKLSPAKYIEDLRAKLRNALGLEEEDDDTLLGIVSEEGAGASASATSLTTPCQKKLPTSAVSVGSSEVEILKTPSLVGRKSPPKLLRASPPGVTEVHPQRMTQLLGVKLGTYDGNSDIELFLDKFENCSSYCGWNERDRRFQLKQALEGKAERVV